MPLITFPTTLISQSTDYYFNKILPTEIARLSEHFSINHNGIYEFTGTDASKHPIKIYATPLWDDDNHIPVEITADHGKTHQFLENLPANFFTGTPEIDAQLYLSNLTHCLSKFQLTITTS